MEESVNKVPRGGLRKWIVISCVVLLVLAGVLYLIFGVNQFYMTIELKGEENQILEYGEQWVDPGAEAVIRGTLFMQNGYVPENAVLTVDDQVDLEKLGEYQVKYTGEYRWFRAEGIRSVHVEDTQCPEIKLVADPYLELIDGTKYKEEGFSAVDNYDGDLTELVDRKELYGRIVYTVSDSSGNQTSVERKIAYYDPLPPTILLEGEKTIMHQVGRPFVEPGYIALDNVDGEITDRVFIEGEVDCFTPGIYPITYTAEDNHGNWGLEVRTVEVVKAERPEVIQPKGKVIYLTFDDGPGPFTDELLYLLKYYGVKATFFVTDSGYDYMMGRIVEEGHSIGIHTVNHDYETIYKSPENYFADLYEMQQIIYDNTGVMTTLLRFPGGSSNLVSRTLYKGLMTKLTRAVQDAGFQYFDWNVDSNDAGGATDQQTVAANVIDGISKERISIVLQHDIHPYSVNAVEEIILWGLENGYTFQPLTSNSPTAHHPIYN